MSHQEHENLEPYMEDCSDTDDEYTAYQYHNNNNNNIPSSNNNNNTEFEDKNNNNRSGTSGAGQHTRTQQPHHQPHQGSVPSFHHKLHDRPLNITVTAKVLFGSVSAISALNAERKKKPS